MRAQKQLFSHGFPPGFRMISVELIGGIPGLGTHHVALSKAAMRSTVATRVCCSWLAHPKPLERRVRSIGHPVWIHITIHCRDSPSEISLAFQRIHWAWPGLVGENTSIEATKKLEAPAEDCHVLPPSNGTWRWSSQWSRFLSRGKVPG